MTYSETLEYLYKQLPMFQRVGAVAFKKDLSNTIRLCDALGNPQNEFASIHVAGTNGKGSVTHMTAAILQQAGFKTGIYCSPHLKDFRERIKIDGQMVPEEWVVDWVAEHKKLIEDITPSFFEITVAMAFDYFAQEKVDVAVIEVGMGGRLDSTNVIRPELSIITSIGHDHQQYLGNKLEDIAFEKAGTIKPGTPVIIGETHPDTEPTFRDVAEGRQAPIAFGDQYLALEETDYSLESTTCSVGGLENLVLDEITIQSGANYQVANARTTLAAMDELISQGVAIKTSHVAEGMARFKDITNFLGRWQVIDTGPPLVLADCAHNPEALGMLFQQLRRHQYQRLHLVIGTVSDKALPAYLRSFPKEATFYFAKPDIPRGLEAHKLMQTAHGFGRRGTAYESVSKAFAAAKESAQIDDLVVVTGSIFVVAEVL